MEVNTEKQDHLMAIDGSDIEIDIGGDGTRCGVEEEREKEENASEKEDDVEEEEEEEEDGGGEEEKEGEGYTFRFKHGDNPFEIFNNSDSGVPTYQIFERLECEAHANKKRKAEQCHREGTSSKKAREDDISGATEAEIMEVMNFGERRRSRERRTKKRGRRKGSKKKLDEKLSRMLGDANIHYSNCRYDKAIAVLHEVVRLEPNLPDSYHILGLVHSALGDRKREMDFYMIAAHLTPKDFGKCSLRGPCVPQEDAEK